MSLRMQIQVRAVREATEAEVEAGSVATNPLAVSAVGGRPPPSQLH
jgi:hypothetical protein